MMKHIILFIVIALITAKVTAQVKVEQALKGRANAQEPSLLAKDIINQIGKEVYVCDRLDSYVIVNDTLKKLYIGNRSFGLLIVIVKGGKVHFNPSDFTLSKVRVSGKVILYNNVPAIIVTTDTQLGTRIQI